MITMSDSRTYDDMMSYQAILCPDEHFFVRVRWMCRSS